MEFVKAVKEDLNFLYRLRNNQVDLKFSRRGQVSRAQIEKEFLNSERQTYLVALGDKYVGYVAFDPVDDITSEISIAVVPGSRKNGVGRSMLYEATKFAVEKLNKEIILACIDKSNIASLKIFHNNFYNLTREDDHYVYLVYKKKERHLVFAYDMDGVLVKSVEVLYQVYLDIVKRFGIGSKTEFDKLDGKTIPEVVAYLKDAYNIKKPYKRLLDMYQRKIEKAYYKLKISEDMMDLLRHQKSNNVRIAITSSAAKELIVKVVNNSDAQDIFDYIVSGDDVKYSKPNPEIYKKVIDRFGKCNIYYAMEDSESGLKAASLAGFKTIHITDEDNAENV